MMNCRPVRLLPLLLLLCGLALTAIAGGPLTVHVLAVPPVAAAVNDPGAGPAAWVDDLSPIAAADWSYGRAAHLIERAGFGDTPEQIQRLASMTPQQAVDALVDYERFDTRNLK